MALFVGLYGRWVMKIMFTTPWKLTVASTAEGGVGRWVGGVGYLGGMRSTHVREVKVEPKGRSILGLLHYRAGH